MKIEISNLSFNYDFPSTEVLKDINLTINSGEVVALMGASGSGKSTLIKLLLSFLKPTDGKITFGSIPVICQTPFNSLAYVPQASIKTLFPWLTVEEHLYYPNKLRKSLTAECKIYCNSLLETLKLSHKKKSYPLQLSGGEQKRLTLAVAFSYKPKIFLLDEPFSGIDFKLAEELWDVLYNYFKINRPTVLLATHSLDEASLIANRVLFLNSNKGLTEVTETISDFGISLMTPLNKFALEEKVVEYKRHILQQFNLAVDEQVY